MFLGLVALLALGGTWSALDRRSQAAAWVRQTWRRLGARQLVASAVAAIAFVAICEDVVFREDDEIVLRLDSVVQQAAHLVAPSAAIRNLASFLSRLTGEGMLATVATAAACLVAVGRRRDGLVILFGTASAWILSAGLKMAFGVVRPGSHQTWYEITGYGFPSAHTLVAVVGYGLLAVALGRNARPAVRAALYAGALVFAALTGAARLVLDVHWLSDVAAGFAIGVVWLNLVRLVAVAGRSDVGAGLGL
jgi:undecaprenyl-diphosphatase